MNGDATNRFGVIPWIRKYLLREGVRERELNMVGGEMGSRSPPCNISLHPRSKRILIVGGRLYPAQSGVMLSLRAQSLSLSARVTASFERSHRPSPSFRLYTARAHCV